MERHQRRVLGRPQHTSLMNPTACFSPAVTHPGTEWGHTRENWEREYCGKSDIFSLLLLGSLQKMFTVLFFHEAIWAVTVRTESRWSGHNVYSWQKAPKIDEYRSVHLCVVSAFTVNVRSIRCWIYVFILCKLSNVSYLQSDLRCRAKIDGLLREFLTWCCNLTAVIIFWQFVSLCTKLTSDIQLRPE